MNVRELPVSPSWRTDAVPKIIHQTAPADRGRWHPIWSLCQPTWQKHFPDYEYKFWNDVDIEAFMRTRFPSFYPSFMGFRYQIHRVDAFRYFLLYDVGGIYADMDYECVKPFSHLLPPGKVSIAENMHFPDRFQNALMASPPRHPFWLHVFEELLKNYTKQMDASLFRSVLNSTGPGMLECAWQGAPAEYLNPLPKNQFSFFEKEVSALCLGRNSLEPITDPSVYAAHYCTIVWRSSGT